MLGQGLFAQSQYEVSTGKKGEKIYKGIISPDLLQSDTSFKWYAENLKSYNPNSVALQALREHGDSTRLVVFMGTWCEDSHVIIPKFYSLISAAGFSADKVSLLGVDRSKKTLGYLAEALDVKNVPTIIVFKNGKEAGRVVEYGKYGMWDKELGEIINAASGVSKSVN